MKSYHFILGTLGMSMLLACGGPESKSSENPTPASSSPTQEKSAADAAKGVGKFTQVDISPSLNTTMAQAGNKVYDMKCSSCHRLNDERLVGPGWKGVTNRRKPEWIMNFVTNVDEMLNKDANAQAMLETCLVRMPNQNLTDDDARNVYEFMRKNDGVK